MVGRFPGERAALALVFGVLEEERLRWQRVRIKQEDIAWTEEATKALEAQLADIKALRMLAVQEP